MGQEKWHQLLPGTILDERYEIQGVLGEGGFGITYVGVNTRVQVKVAIKELYSAETMKRDCRETNEVSLLYEEDREEFHRQKSKFLKEARIVGDFAKEAGVVNVSDYFEANGTAYIVMEYLEGITLKQRVEREGRFEPEDIFRRMIPLLETLGKIHACGVIHRDISPDNIMLMPDGTLRLMDFGAARDYAGEMDKTRSIVLKGGYAPREQYDSKGKQGPWTDVYALAATLYYCVTGNTPQDTLQRILHDELQSPGKMGIQMKEDLERIIMKGLALAPENRYSSVEAMKEDIGNAFPHEEKVKIVKQKRFFIAGALVGLLCVAVIAGAFYVKAHYVELKFRGIETETVKITANENMTTKEFYEAARIVEERYKVLAGENNYIWKEEEGVITVITPYEVYGGRDMMQALEPYITRWCNTFLQDENGKMYGVGIEDIERTEIMEGEIEGADREEWGLPETGDYRYLAVTLTEERAAGLNGMLDTEGDFAYLVQDYSEEYDLFFSGLNTYVVGDGRTFYVIDDIQTGKYLELMEYDMTHEGPLYILSYEYEEKIKPEGTEEKSPSGENQCSENSLQGETMLLKYATSHEDVSSADVIHMQSMIQARLDPLGIPYAISIGENGRDILVKMEASHKWDMLWDILIKDGTGVVISERWGDICGLSNKMIAEWEAQPSEDGNYQLMLDISGEYQEEDIYNKTKELLDAGEGTLYIEFAGKKLLSCTIDKPVEDGCIVFDQVMLDDETKLSEDILPLVDFLHGVVMNPDIPMSYYSLTDIQYLSSEGEIQMQDEDVNLNERLDETREEEIQKTIGEMGGECTWEYAPYEGEKLTIKFTVDDTEQLLQETFRTSKELYEKLELQDGYFSSVTIRFYEAENPSGFLDTEFWRNSVEREMELFGVSILVGEDSEAMKEECRTYIEKDDFYSNMLCDNFWESFVNMIIGS